MNLNDVLFVIVPCKHINIHDLRRLRLTSKTTRSVVDYNAYEFILRVTARGLPTLINRFEHAAFKIHVVAFDGSECLVARVASAGTRVLSRVQLLDVTGQQCQKTVDGLLALFPNLVGVRFIDAKMPGPLTVNSSVESVIVKNCKFRKRNTALKILKPNRLKQLGIVDTNFAQLEGLEEAPLEQIILGKRVKCDGECLQQGRLKVLSVEPGSVTNLRQLMQTPTMVSLIEDVSVHQLMMVNHRARYLQISLRRNAARLTITRAVMSHFKYLQVVTLTTKMENVWVYSDTFEPLLVLCRLELEQVHFGQRLHLPPALTECVITNRNHYKFSDVQQNVNKLNIPFQDSKLVKFNFTCGRLYNQNQLHLATQLTVVNLAYIRLNVTKWAALLPELRRLSVRGCKVKRFKDLYDATQLTHLNIRDSSALDLFAGDISRMTRLESLRICGGQHTLPSGIAQLTQLKQLSLCMQHTMYIAFEQIKPPGVELTPYEKCCA
jgi:hypothetical protein